MPLEVSERIRFWMTDRGVSWSSLQEQLHRRGTSVSESTMSRLLNGKSEPKIGTLGAIAEVLEVELRDLMPAGRAAARRERSVAAVPTAHWASGGGLELNNVGRKLLVDQELVPRDQPLVALETTALAMAPMVSPGDVLIVNLTTEVPEGSLVLIMDPETGLERLMWLHRVADDVVQYSDLNGYLLGPPDLVKGHVALVIRQPVRLKEPLPEPPHGGWELASAIAERMHA